MANSYYDATGVLILDQVTPVITALFGAFRLDATYPGDGEVYIARLSESDDPQWDDVLDGLVELAKAFGQPLPASDELGLQAVLRALANHFRAENREDLKHLTEHHAFEDTAELEDLFLIATCFDDGHGLTAIKLEGAWYCDKPRLFEFGGEGVFISREVTLYGTSSLALELGHGLREALLQGNLDEAADVLTQDLNRLLSGIRDADTREALRRKLARKLI
jgi:hypothetical protein